MDYQESKKNAPLFWLPGIFLFVILIVVDQTAKHLAHSIFQNNAFAFSLPIPTALIYLIYAAVVAAMVWYVAGHYKNFSKWDKISWTLIFAGAASNIIERMIFGFVRDFIYISFYKWIGVYNLADGYIIVGILILLLFPNKNSKLQMPNIK